MKTEQIIYLNDIAKTHSITQTAQRFFISQQALSFSLKKLEEEFDTIFLNRTNQGVTLTREGSIFLHKAQAILDIYSDLKEDFLFQSASEHEEVLPAGKLDILGHTRVLEPLLMDIFESYSRKYPQIQLILQEEENIAIINAISQGTADLGIIFAPEPLLKNTLTPNQYHLPDNVTIETLFSDDFIVCCNCNHPLAQNKNIDFNNFPDTATVLFDTDALIRTIGFSPNTSQKSHLYYSNNVSFHKAMIRRGLVVSVITAFEFRKLYFKHKDLTALSTSNSCKSVISIVTNKERPLSTAAQLFIHMLEKYDFYSL